MLESTYLEDIPTKVGIVSSKIDLVLFFFEIHVGKLQQEYSNNLC